MEDLQFTLVVELAEPDDTAFGEQSGVGRAVLGEVALVVVQGDYDAQVLLEPVTEGLENVHLIVLLLEVLLVGEHLLDFLVRVETADLSRTYKRIQDFQELRFYYLVVLDEQDDRFVLHGGHLEEAL